MDFILFIFAVVGSVVSIVGAAWLGWRLRIGAGDVHRVLRQKMTLLSEQQVKHGISQMARQGHMIVSPTLDVVQCARCRKIDSLADLRFCRACGRDIRIAGYGYRAMREVIPDWQNIPFR